jgi:hypothetical protein
VPPAGERGRTEDGAVGERTEKIRERETGILEERVREGRKRC